MVDLVWFKRDLRCRDHLPLAEAAKRGPFIALYILEPDLWAQPDMSRRQYDHLLACLTELDQELASLGGRLTVRIGAAVDVLADLHLHYRLHRVWSHQETGNEWTFERDKQVAAWAAANGIIWREPMQFGVHRRLSDRNGWAQKWDAMMVEEIIPAPQRLTTLSAQSDPLPTPEQMGLKEDGLTRPQPAGRKAALETLQSFLTERGEDYRKGMSSPLSGAVACSRLSTHLAFGSLSIREAATATQIRQREVKNQGIPGKWRGALSSFCGRLHWHCHFIQKLEDFPAMERLALHPGCRDFPSEENAELRHAWETGTTGLPFVDACMRSLIATGWLNFRMRAMVTAVASHHLNLPWRKTGQYLARMFTDYEAGIHWPQIQMQSGLTGINTVRIYNPVKQGYDQDPTGAFVWRWVPELRDVPTEHIHEPWKSGHAEPPVIDHMAAARTARERIYGARRGTAFREESDRIQQKHGSRKAGLPRTRRPKRVEDPRQTQLDL